MKKTKPPVPESVRPPLIEGLEHFRTGKVSQLFHLPNYEDLLFQLFSDCASVHDIPLPFTVPKKGMTLNLLDFWWRQQFPWVRHSVVAIGRGIDKILPERYRGNSDYHLRGRIIQRHTPLLVELIYRWLLTGTGLTQYSELAGKICGQQMPAGLKEWDELNPSAATPTTKSLTGHDEAMLLENCIQRFGRGPIELTHPLFEIARRIAFEKGIAIADTKCEVAMNEKGELVLIDEVLTPDTSRYIRWVDILEARRTGKKPPSFDKQPIRDYVWETHGVGPKTPLTPENVGRVQGHMYPISLIEQTTSRYEEITKILIGVSGEEFAASLN